MKRASLLLLAVLASGCGHLRPDPSKPAIDAGYPTVEIVCGDRFNGLGACAYDTGSSSPLSFSVQGYYKGVLRTDSERCQIAESRTYTGSQTIEFQVTPTESCVIDFVLSPDYPKSSSVPVSSLKGRLYVKVLKPGQRWLSLASKVSDGTDETLRLSVDQEARVVIRGCGAAYDKVKTPIAGKIEIKLSELGMNRKDCLYEGTVLLADPVRFTWQVWAYSNEFVPLATPEIRINGDKLEVLGAEAVAIVALDQKFKLGNTLKTDAPAQGSVLRLLTAGGRTVLGVWNGLEFKWMR